MKRTPPARKSRAGRKGRAPARPAVDPPRAAAEDVEARVAERTRELAILNEELHAEIRDRIHAEQALLAEMAVREAIESCLNAGVVAVDRRGRHTHVNDAFCTMTGYPRARLLGVGMPYPYWPPTERAAYEARMRELLKGGPVPEEGIEMCFESRAGRPVQVALYAAPLRIGGRLHGTVATVHNITGRKRTEVALRDSEARFRSLVQSLPVGVCIVQDGEIVFANPEQEKLSRPPPGSGAIANVHPDDAAALEALCREGGERPPSGKESDLRIVAPDLSAADGEAEPLWVRCKAAPIQYRGRRAVLLTMMDITRAKELERFATVRERLASLGQLSAGLAHEIRNPLSGINIYLSTMEELFAKSGEAEPEARLRLHEILGQVRSASSKIAGVIQSVMDFSKPGPPRVEAVDLNRIVGEALRVSTAGLRTAGVAVSERLAPDLPACRGDARLIEQVLVNLITNGVQAMESNAGPRRLEISTAAERAGRIVLRVADSGHGVPARIRQRIFEPFFTTRRGGYGIGLSISHKIVTEHGGSISVGTSRWGGAEFRIILPAAGEESAA